MVQREPVENEKDSIVFRDGVEYDTAFFHSHISMEKVKRFMERIYTVKTNCLR